jgi:hypothetical protein
VFAHEVGHSIGMLHDHASKHGGTGNTTCANQGRTSYGQSRPARWSQCSNEDYVTWFRSTGFDCMHGEKPFNGGSGGPVVCGNHEAPSCGECTQGNGASWCNVDCKWFRNECVARAGPTTLRTTLRTNAPWVAPTRPPFVAPTRPPDFFAPTRSPWAAQTQPPWAAPAPISNNRQPVSNNQNPNCGYKCQPNGGCEVTWNGPPRSGSTLGSCFPPSFGGACSGTPQGCQDCLTQC